MKKILLSFAMLIVGVFTLASCTSNPASSSANNSKSSNSTGENLPEITKDVKIWVGKEAVDFYKTAIEDYKKITPTFKAKVEILPSDAGSAAADFQKDPDAGADLFIVAHDNIGKLVGISGVPAIQPLSGALVDQIKADNTEEIKTVMQNDLKTQAGNMKVYYGVPVMSQAVILYYDKTKLTADDVQNWEKIKAKAAALNDDVQATSLLGTDSFNNSFVQLATNAADHSSSLKLYEDGIADNTVVTGDDMVAKIKWAQKFFDQNEAGSAKWPTDSNFSVELKDGHSLSLIGGAWNLAAVEEIYGDNIGIAKLPKFTITADEAYGTCKAGTVFQSGTFADVKCFVMKAQTDPNRVIGLSDLLKYLSSKEVQEKCFVDNGSVPSYKNALTEFKSMQDDSKTSVKMAKIQLEMSDWGIPQPFGLDPHFNTYYYSKSGDALFQDLMKDPVEFSTPEKILDQLKIIENIYKTGTKPAADATA